MIWDWLQQSQINETQHGLNRAERADERLRERIGELETRLDAMALYTAALWELVSTRTSISTDEFHAKVDEIDLRDGVQDGRITPQPRTCPSCKRTIAGRHARCIYCGAPPTGRI